jgi:hypothetical protein
MRCATNDGTTLKLRLTTRGSGARAIRSRLNVECRGHRLIDRRVIGHIASEFLSRRECRVHDGRHRINIPAT